MAAYAGMLEYVDMSVGRIIAHLREKNMLDNTMILFLSDNGGESAELTKFFPDYYAKNFDLSYEHIGEKGSYSEYGPGWASVSMTPFSNFKGSASEGGVRAPLIIRYPRAMRFRRDLRRLCLRRRSRAHHPCGRWIGRPGGLTTFLGMSILPLLQGKASEVRGDTPFAQEVAGGAAVYAGDFKLARNAPPFGDFKWRLYDLKADPAESNDLSAEQPQRVEALRAAYAAYVKAKNVVEVPETYSVDGQLKANMARASK